MFFSCQKSTEESKPIEPTHDVKYTLYSNHVPYVFGHCQDNRVFGLSPLDTIRTNNYTVTLKVKDNAMRFYQYISNISYCDNDSLYIKAEYENKKVEDIFSCKAKGSANHISLSIQLSEAK